ncbi:MAG: SpoIID/LytB domain-containing protein [Crocinitomicaceae bacterium]
MHKSIVILFLLMFFSVFGQEQKIGILRDYKVKRVTLSHHLGQYNVWADTSFVGTINPQEFIEVELVAGKLALKYNTIPQGKFSKISVRPIGNGTIIIKSKVPTIRERKYQDNFEISVVKGRMTIVNKVSMENYLCGVIESEGGGGRHAEYYKVQAVMSRTYAHKNKSRHRKEGFGLCDGVHCQAYHNMLRYTPEIRTAVRETKDEVLVDENNRLVTTYFSANCGGEVCDASHVWNNSVDHVKPFIDTFCIHTRQAKWTKRISQWEFRNYLVKQFGYPIYDSLMAKRIYSFEQETRKAFYIHPSLGIPLRDLRSKFKLKSTFFSTHPEGSEVVFEGRGFGHGVGLCQEGAMNMAKYNFTYRQIAEYYFYRVRVKKYSKL